MKTLWVFWRGAEKPTMVLAWDKQEAEEDSDGFNTACQEAMSGGDAVSSRVIEIDIPIKDRLPERRLRLRHRGDLDGFVVVPESWAPEDLRFHLKHRTTSKVRSLNRIRFMSAKETNESSLLAEEIVQAIEAYVNIRIRDALAQARDRTNFYVSNIAQAREGLKITVSKALRPRGAP